jgi:hypothetical protein
MKELNEMIAKILRTPLKTRRYNYHCKQVDKMIMRANLMAIRQIRHWKNI